MTPSGRSHHIDPPTNTTGDGGELEGVSRLPLTTTIEATPQRTSTTQTHTGSFTPTSTLASAAQTPRSSGPGKGTDSPYRLLYRGALSLPDSYLQLDGIAFSAHFPNRQATMLQDSPSCSLSRSDSFARELMQNPLALALESMRGRQSLRLKGTVRLQDVWMDDTGDVYMDIHPLATLTKIYFENILCLSPLVAPSHDPNGPKRTEVGVRVSLGDTDGPETTDVIIYGETDALLHPPSLQLLPAATSTSVEPSPLSVRAARITPAPRAPRPDDPTPRQPPAHLFGSTTLAHLGANKRIQPRPTAGSDKGRIKGEDRDKVEDQVLRRAREVMLHLPRSRVSESGNRKTRDKSMRERIHQRNDSVFKVPELPPKARQKQADPGTDIFGTVELPLPRSINGKGKGRTTTVAPEDNEIGEMIEGANKLVLKKLTAHHLADAGIPRSHPEFKDVYGFVYRGAGFALRSQMKTLHINVQAAEAVVQAHVNLYALTAGDIHNTSRSQATILPNTMDLDDTGG